MSCFSAIKPHYFILSVRLAENPMTLFLTFRRPLSIGGLLFFFHTICYAQSVKDSFVSDSVFNRPSFQSFVKQQLTQLGIPEKDALLRNLSIVKPSKKSSIPTFHGSVSFDYFWNQGDTLLYGDAANQSFSYVTPDLGVSVLGMPIRVGGNLVFQNQTWRRDLSTYTFQLDYETLLAQKKQQLKDAVLQEKRESWSKEELEIWANKAKWDALYNIVYSPQFQATKQGLEQRLDSLKGKASGYQDSARRFRNRVEGEIGDKMGQIRDSTDKVTTKIEGYKNTAVGYAQQFEQQKTALEAQLRDYTDAQKQVNQLLNYYEKNNKAFEKADSLRGTVEKLEAEWTKRKAQAEGLKTGFKDIVGQKLQKFMGSIQQLDVGSVWLTGSDLTVRSLLLNGVRLQTQTGKIYNEIAFGKQNTATRDYAVGFQTINGARDLNRQVAYLRSGVGAKDSNYLHISLTRILDSYKDTLQTIQKPHYNDLLGISMREKLGNKADLIGEMAYSIFQNNSAVGWTSSPETVQTQQKPSDYAAFQVKIKAAEGRDWQWSLGYDYIGTKFTTLGNPYLLNNRQILRGTFGKSFWQQKVSVKLAYDKNVALPNAANTVAVQPTIDQTGFSAELGVRYGRGNRFVAKLAPRYFLLSAAGGTEGVGRNDVYTIQNTFQGKIKKMRWLSFINLTNINTLMPMRDSGQLTGFNYVFLQNMLMISDKWTLSAIGNLGLEGTLKTAILREATAQFNSQWTFKKGTLGVGIQTYKTLENDVQMGGNISSSVQMAKLGAFGLQFSYRESTNTTLAKRPILSGQTFYKCSF